MLQYVVETFRHRPGTAITICIISVACCRFKDSISWLKIWDWCIGTLLYVTEIVTDLETWGGIRKAVAGAALSFHEPVRWRSTSLISGNCRPYYVLFLSTYSVLILRSQKRPSDVQRDEGLEKSLKATFVCLWRDEACLFKDHGWRWSAEVLSLGNSQSIFINRFTLRWRLLTRRDTI